MNLQNSKRWIKNDMITMEMGNGVQYQVTKTLREFTT